MKKNLIVSISILIIAGLALAACQSATNLPEVDPGSQTQVAIFAQATLTKYAEQKPLLETAVPEEPSPTPMPTEAETPAEEASPAPVEETDTPTEEPTAVPTEVPTEVPTAQPTPIPQPTTPPTLPEPPAGHERVSFATGTTNKTVSASVEAGKSKQYVVWLSQSQLLEITGSADTVAYIAVKAPSGKVLVTFDNRWTWYRDFAQETGDYVIEVTGGQYASNFILTVRVPHALEFEQGATSLVARATVPGEYSHDFNFWANQGQNMKITLSQPEKFVLSIIMADGTPILSADSKANSYDAVLPRAGTYIVTIHNISKDAATTDFNLSIK